MGRSVQYGGALAGVDTQPAAIPAGEAIAKDDLVQVSYSGKAWRAKPRLGVALLNKSTPGLGVAFDNTVQQNGTLSTDYPSYQVDQGRGGVVLGNGNFAVIEVDTVLLVYRVRAYNIYGDVLWTYNLPVYHQNASNSGSSWMRIRVVDTNNVVVVMGQSRTSTLSVIQLTNDGAVVRSLDLTLPSGVTGASLIYGNTRNGVSNDAIVSPDGYLIVCMSYSSGQYFASYSVAGGYNIVGWTPATGNQYLRNVQMFTTGTSLIAGFYNGQNGWISSARWTYTTVGSSNPTFTSALISGVSYPSANQEIFEQLNDGRLVAIYLAAGKLTVGVCNTTTTGFTSQTLLPASTGGEGSYGALKKSPDGSIVIASFGPSVLAMYRLSVDGAMVTKGTIDVSVSFSAYTPSESYQSIVFTPDRIVVSYMFNDTSSYKLQLIEFDLSIGTVGGKVGTGIVYQFPASGNAAPRIAGFLNSGSMTLMSMNHFINPYNKQVTMYFWDRNATLFGVALTAAAKDVNVNIATKGNFSNLPADQRLVPGAPSDARAFSLPGPKLAWIGQTVLMSGINS